MSQNYRIVFQKSGKEAVWDGSHDSLLELAEELGVDIPYACRSGLDEVCRTVIVEGTVDHPGAALPVDDGVCLPCIAVPQSDLILEA